MLGQAFLKNMPAAACQRAYGSKHVTQVLCEELFGSEAAVWRVEVLRFGGQTRETISECGIEFRPQDLPTLKPAFSHAPANGGLRNTRENLWKSKEFHKVSLKKHDLDDIPIVFDEFSVFPMIFKDFP